MPTYFRKSLARAGVVIAAAASAFAVAAPAQAQSASDAEGCYSMVLGVHGRLGTASYGAEFGEWPNGEATYTEYLAQAEALLATGSCDAFGSIVDAPLRLVAADIAGAKASAAAHDWPAVVAGLDQAQVDIGSTFSALRELVDQQG